MATITTLCSRNTVNVDLNVTDVAGSADSTNNTTKVAWSLVLRRGSKNWDTSWTGWGKKIYATVYIEGMGTKTIYIPQYNYNGKNLPGSVFDSGDFPISHAADGTKTISFSVSLTDNGNGHNNGSYYTPGNAPSKSGTLTLQTVPRYFSSTPTLRLTDRTETTATFAWTTPETCSQVQYKINNGSWVDVTSDANNTSGSFTITGLTAGTAYTIYADFKRRDSGLWAQTKPSAGVTTHPYPYLNSVPEFTVGNKLTIGVTNPLGRSCEIYIIDASGTQTHAGTISSGSLSGFDGTGWLNTWYKSLPKAKKGQYKARLTCSTGNVDQTSSAVWYYLNNSDSNYNPVFPTDNIIDIKNTLNTDIAGSNYFIKNHNKLICTIKPMTGQHYADVTTGYYNLSSSGLATVKKNYSSSNITNVELGNMSTNSFNVTAVDGRGFTTTQTKTINLVNYNNPGVSTSKIIRQNGIGTKAVIHFEGVYTNWIGLLKDNLIKEVKYKVGSSGTWKALPSDAVLTNANGLWTLDATLNDTFETASQYDLYLQVTDLLETVEFGSYTVSTADAFVWKDLANKRIGINKKPTEALDVAGNIKSSGDVEGINIKGNALYINGVKMIWYE